MSKTSMEVTMSEDLKARLHAIAPKVGKTVQEFAQEALYTFVEDYEDGLLLEESRKQNGPTFTQEEMERKFALDDSIQGTSRKTA